MTRGSIRSFAIGMLITTGLFAGLFYFKPGTIMIENDETPMPAVAISEEAVEEYVQQHNKVLLTQEEYEKLVSLQEKIENTKIQMTAEQNDDIPDESETDTEEPKVVKEDEKSLPQTSEGNEIKESNNSQPKEYKYTLSIRSGMNSIQISNLLEQNNIVQDANEFQNFLLKNNLNRYIQIGAYEVSNQMSYEDIARIITRR